MIYLVLAQQPYEKTTRLETQDIVVVAKEGVAAKHWARDKQKQ